MKKVLVILCLAVSLCVGLFLGKILFKESENSEINMKENFKVHIPIYQCTSLDDENDNFYIAGVERAEDLEDRSIYSPSECDIIGNYECLHDICYIEDSNDWLINNNLILYDNNSKNEGGYYLIDIEKKKSIIGPYTSMEYIGGYNHTVSIKKDDKYGIYSVKYPENEMLFDFIFDYVSTSREGIVKKCENDICKYCLIDPDYATKNTYQLECIYDEISESGALGYVIVKKDDKYNIAQNENILSEEWYDYIYIQTDEDNKDYYITYISDGKLNYAVKTITNVIVPIGEPVKVNFNDDMYIYSYVENFDDTVIHVHIEDKDYQYNVTKGILKIETLEY